VSIRIEVGKGHEIYGTVETTAQGLVFAGRHADSLRRLVESMRLRGMSDEELLRSIPERLGYYYWANVLPPHSATDVGAEDTVPNDGGDHPLRPGYFLWDGIPAIRREHAGWPVFWTRSGWQHVPDLCKFDHEARRISRREFREALRSVRAQDREE